MLGKIAMDTSSIDIRYGEFKDVLAHPRQLNNVTLIPAVIGLTGPMLTNGSFLDEYLQKQRLPVEVRALIRLREDAPWACGRIQYLFSLPQVPEEDRGEKCCMAFEFLAALEVDGKLTGVPFWCSDYYGRSVLIFSGAAPPEDVINTIAAAFWGILIENPTELIDYTDRFSHLGGGFDVEFGVEDGEPFMREVRE
jgi:hypothetical protein